MTASAKPLKVSAFGQSDIGLVRKNNEDSFLIANLTSGIVTPSTAAVNDPIPTDANLFIVADGMGGMQAGEVASHMAVDLVARNMIDQLKHKHPTDQQSFVKILERAVQETNRFVFQEGQRDSQLRGMGTTLTAAAVHGGSLFIAQLGDSRAYLIRHGAITLMTRDQSLVAQMVDSGALSPEEANVHPRRNVILQALGVQPQVDVVISCAELKRGDQLVLCSDGLWGKVEAEESAELIERFDPTTACQSLVQLARDRGGEDNITVIVAYFDGEGLPPPDPDDVPVYDRFREKTQRRFWRWGRS
jgi:serine/threonine protein phosphatase PrpC